MSNFVVKKKSEQVCSLQRLNLDMRFIQYLNKLVIGTSRRFHSIVMKVLHGALTREVRGSAVSSLPVTAIKFTALKMGA